MRFLPYQQRVIEEKEQLDAKTKVLTVFVGGPVFLALPITKQQWICKEGEIMREYSEILGQRIAAFEGGDDE